MTTADAPTGSAPESSSTSLGDPGKPPSKNAIALTWALIQSGGWWWVLVPVSGYGFAWLAHFTVEKNRPATFTYPLWSLAIFALCMLVIYGLVVQGAARGRS